MKDETLYPVSDLQNLNEALPEIYNHLKRLAIHHLKNERTAHTLRPTELVHEVYLLLQKEHSLNIQDRLHFLRLASTMMRHILVNYAKHRLRRKHGGGNVAGGFDELLSNNSENLTLIDFEKNQVDIIALEESLNKLATLDERQVRIVELHFFGGLTFEEIADVLEISLRTVQREWRFARTWLYLQLCNLEPT